MRAPIIVKAVYRKTPVNDYNGNPCIEALPALGEPSTFLLGLTHQPPVPSAAVRKKNLWERLSRLEDLKYLILPITEYKASGMKLAKIIRQTYVARNPTSNDEETRRHLIANYDGTQKFTLPFNWKSTATGHLIISSTGTGKSTFINAYFLRLPQVIHHVEYKGRKVGLHQVVFICITVPPDGSLKAFCLTFFVEVDRLLGTNYLAQAYAAETVPKMTLLMWKVFTAISLGTLIIDEFQNLRVLKSEQGVHVLNMLASIIEVMGVSVITVATPKIYDLLHNKARDTRKLIEGGMTIFPVMKKDSPEWALFCSQLWDYTYTKHKKELTDEVRTAWFKASGGNRAFAVMAFKMAQTAAIESEDESVDDQTFDMVYATQLAALQPAIAALVSGSEEEISLFEDLLTGRQGQALRNLMVPFSPDFARVAGDDQEKGLPDHPTPVEEFDEVSGESERPVPKGKRAAKNAASTKAGAKTSAAEKAPKGKPTAAKLPRRPVSADV